MPPVISLVATLFSHVVFSPYNALPSTLMLDQTHAQSAMLGVVLKIYLIYPRMLQMEMGQLPTGLWSKSALKQSLPGRYIFSSVYAERTSAFPAVCGGCPCAGHRAQLCCAPSGVCFSVCAVISVINSNIIVCRAWMLLWMGLRISYSRSENAGQDFHKSCPLRAGARCWLHRSSWFPGKSDILCTQCTTLDCSAYKCQI